MRQGQGNESVRGGPIASLTPLSPSLLSRSPSLRLSAGWISLELEALYLFLEGNGAP